MVNDGVAREQTVSTYVPYDPSQEPIFPSELQVIKYAPVTSFPPTTISELCLKIVTLRSMTDVFL